MVIMLMSLILNLGYNDEPRVTSSGRHSRLKRAVSSFWQRLNWELPVVIDPKSILHVVGMYACLCELC